MFSSDPVFSSDKGAACLADFRPVDAEGQAHAAPVRGVGPISAAASDPLALIERLAELRQKGILTEEEFTAKKAELLARV